MNFSLVVWTIGVIVFLMPIKIGICAQIHLNQNGYTGVVVAIDRNIPQVKCDVILSGIKKLLNISSQYLYQSMRRRAYFAEINILVPPTWSRQVWMEKASGESYETADIKIEQSDVISVPRVDKMGPECGTGAKAIILPDNFLLYVNSLATFGGDHDPGRWLINLWSQFRYGVYDEHGYANDKSYPYFYFDEKLTIPMPTACSTADLLLGDVVDVRTGQPCTSLNEMMYGGYCEYILSHAYDITNSSINYAHYFSPITQFCDDTEEYLHNTRAPTKQNAYCVYRSTWNVIMQHEDFANESNQPRDIDNVVPNIRIVYPSQHHYVLAFDTSEDNNEDKLNWFRQALIKFVEYEAVYGLTIGMVVFNSNSTVVLNMTQIINKDTKQTVINSFTSKTEPLTCIGCGLRESLKLLQSTNTVKGGVIVVISDGNENQDPRVEDVTDELLEAGVQIYWIAYGNHSCNDLSELATETRSRVYNALDGVQGASSIASALFEITSLNQQFPKIMLMDDFIIINDSKVSGEFTVDLNSGKNTIMTVMYDNGTSPPHVNLYHPQGYRSLSSTMTDSSYDNILSINIPLAQPGIWTYDVESSMAQQKVVITVVSDVLSTDSDSQILINGWTNVGFSEVNASARAVLLFASVTRGSYPLLNADVVAVVTSSCQGPVEVKLYDSGAVPDVEKFDGVYSRYYKEFCGVGRYGIQIRVNGSTSLFDSYLNPFHSHDFQRVSTCGGFMLVDYVYPKLNDTLAPARILDLRIIQNASYSEINSALFEWTASGNDYDYGIADHYEMKYSQNVSALHGTEFIANPSVVTSNMVLHGSLDPLIAGSKQWAVIQFPGSVSRYYFVAIAAVDEAGNMPSESNVVQVFLPTFCQFEGEVFTDHRNCSIYYVCERVGMPPIAMACPSDLCYKTSTGICDWPD